MVCKHCGAQAEENAVFCTNCGAKLVSETEPCTSGEPVNEAPVFEQTEPSFEGKTEAFVSSASGIPAAEPGAETPKDYLTINIILTVVSALSCCCNCMGVIALITGVIGIVFSSQVRSAVAAGNFAAAESKRRVARAMWITTAIVLGVSVILGVVMTIAGISLSSEVTQDILRELEDLY